MKSDFLFFEGIARSPVRAVSLEKPRKSSACPVEQSQEVSRFFQSLLGQAKLDATQYRSKALSRRTAACLRTLGATSVEAALQTLHQRPELAEVALNAVLLGVTGFFRDNVVFDTLRFQILPRLLERQAGLRIWSAACSEGHELYSVAMLLAEEGRLNDSELLGTDCRGEAIRQARSGFFSAESVAGLASHWRRNFFVEGAITAQISPALVKRVQWKVADLFRSVEAGPWHLILWRNMAIYLESAAAEKLWKQLTDQLAPGGFLITGKADHPPAGLPLVRVSSCIYQKPAFAP